MDPRRRIIQCPIMSQVNLVDNPEKGENLPKKIPELIKVECITFNCALWLEGKIQLASSNRISPESHCGLRSNAV